MRASSATKRPKPTDKHVPRNKPDWLAGTSPPYYGLILDRGMLSCLAQGVVNSRIQVWATQLLAEERTLLERTKTDGH